MVKKTPRRQQVRANLPGNVQASVRLTDAVRVVNLSSSGALIEHAERLAQGGTLILALELGELDLRLRARVVWSQRSQGQTQPPPGSTFAFRSGLHFVEIPRETESHLQYYLATLIRPLGRSKPPSTA